LSASSGGAVFGDRPLSVVEPAEGLSIAAVAEAQPLGSLEQREAYEIFQRAHHEWQTLERHRMQDGLQHLLRATELDPSLIAARVDLVNLCVAQGFYGFMSPSVAADIIRRTAESGSLATGPGRRVDESVPDFASGADSMLPALGWVRFHVDRNLSAAFSALSLSAHLPHDPWTTRVRFMFALSLHRFDEAIDLLRSTIRLDPYSAWLQGRLAWALHLAGDAEASVGQINSALRQFPDHAGTNLYGSVILAFNGETARANELAEGLAQRLPYFDLATEVHAYALACAGRADEARAILERLQWLGRERFLLRAFTPAVYVALGEADAAIAELRASDEIRCPWFFQMLADPRLKPLQARPEFQQLCALLPAMEAEAARDPETLA
jgi:tetratricopeptide (TPR) repeat protein